MKVLVIDPVTATISERNWDGHLKTAYQWLRADHITPINTNLGVRLWVDEEGLYKAAKTPRWFIADLYPQQIIGAAMVAPKRGVLPSDLREKLMKEVKWGLLYNPHGPVAGSA